MKITERKLKVELEISVPTISAKDGTVVTINDEEMIKQLKLCSDQIIDDNVRSKVEKIKSLDKKHDFNSFVADCKGLKYDESNKETYKHFVYHYLRNYYMDSYGSNHYHNGGHWEHFSYNSDKEYHVEMLKDKSHASILSVRDNILIHLMAGSGVRMYGTGQYYRRVRPLKTVEEQKEFWSWVFDSKMLKPNDKIEMSEKIKKITSDKDLNRTYHEYEGWFKKYKSVAELVVMKCWRDGSLEVLEWIEKEYGLDLYKADKHRKVVAEENFSMTTACFLVERMHDKRIHDTYNNGVLSRLYTYEKKPLKGKALDTWMNRSFDNLVKFVGWMNKNYPLLKAEESTNYVYEKNTVKKYSSVKEWMEKDLLADMFRPGYEGEAESARMLLERI